LYLGGISESFARMNKPCFLARYAILIFAGLGLGACTTIKVHPIDAASNPTGVVKILNNPESGAEDLQIVIERAFQRHGFGTQIADPNTLTTSPIKPNEYILTYSSSRKWDLAFYLGRADVYLKRGPKMVGEASYDQLGGYNLGKYGSTESKMGPILDQMLAGYR
jgi:hypothetical protein